MSNLSRRSLITSAAALPALAVPAVAIAATEPLPATNPELLALGERLKVLMPLYEALKLKSRRLRDEALAGLPYGFGLKDNTGASSRRGEPRMATIERMPNGTRRVRNKTKLPSQF